MAYDLITRIKNIQGALHLELTGEFDIATCKAIEKIVGAEVVATNLLSRKKQIQKALGFKGKERDGIIGIGTISRLEIYMDKTLPVLPDGSSMIVSKKGLDLIVESEVSSPSFYNTKYRFPTWPGGSSGITIGIGYDLGYNTLSNIKNDWSRYLGASEIKLLQSVAGLKGTVAAKAMSPELAEVSITWESALEVFYTISMPKHARITRNVYPGVHMLSPDAQAAILSLIYNRGNSMDSSDGRIEMRNLKKWIEEKNIVMIAAEIRKMKRLWEGKGLSGLIERREEEAKLVENGTYYILPKDCIIV